MGWTTRLFSRTHCFAVAVLLARINIIPPRATYTTTKLSLSLDGGLVSYSSSGSRKMAEVFPNAKPAYLILAPNFLANSLFFLCRYRYGSSPSTHPPPTANMKTTWKDIPVVPTSQEFLDIVLSRTQRRLPTQIRAGFKISRIRGATVSYHTL
jgi:hypothetical protein